MSRWLWTAELWTPARASRGQIYSKAAPRCGAASGTSNPNRLPDRFQERLQLLGPRRMPKLAQRLRLDLPDALTGDVEGATDLLERVLGSVADAEPHLQDLLLARGERLQNSARLVLQIRHENRVNG